MPKPVKITARTSSITNAFVNGIIPCQYPNESEILGALEILEMKSDHVVCAYCGNPNNQWDHLEPIVENQRPTGYISEIYNLIPCCSVCNSSKSGSNWFKWFTGDAKQNPKNRNIVDLDKRIDIIMKYEKWCKSKRTKLDFEKIVGKKLWEEHWKNHDILIEKMREFQIHSDIVKDKISKSIIENH